MSVLSIQPHFTQLLVYNATVYMYVQNHHIHSSHQNDQYRSWIHLHSNKDYIRSLILIRCLNTECGKCQAPTPDQRTNVIFIIY